jgi:antitoxin HicB
MIWDPDHAWFIRVKELPGCMSQGDTADEAIEMIHDAMRGWIGVALEDGDPVPEPKPDEDYSGKFVVRVPRFLHRQLAEAAEREGVSLNQFINVALGSAVGRASASTSVNYPVSERQPQMAVREKKSKKAG